MTRAEQIPEQVLDFWFEELGPKHWFAVDESLDRQISDRFGDLLRAAANCELWSWRGSAAGRLGEILVLDQFSRNAYRGLPASFAQDPLALSLAQSAVSAGALAELPVVQRPFLLMPYMHSESLVVHRSADTLFNQPGLEETCRFEVRHLEIIERFGRYPHRNEILGRTSTPEELAFLEQPGSRF